jgi:RHS repeat-associated protein
MERGSSVDYYEADGLGSITSLTASNGTVAQSDTYDSFGNTTNSSGSLTNFFRYTAREFDTETNLYYYRARYFDPAAGRFLSEDPLDFETGTNFYDYVANDPTTLIDPWGLWHCAAGANCNFTPEFKKGLDCFQKCIGSTEVIITSGRRPPSPKLAIEDLPQSSTAVSIAACAT